MPWFSRRSSGSAETTPRSVYERINSGEQVALIDVREPEEYADTHVDGSRLIPLGQLPARLSEIPIDRPVVMICRSGNRSGRATAMLRQAGRTNVENMQGGMIAWQQEKLPVRHGRS